MKYLLFFFCAFGFFEVSAQRIRPIYFYGDKITTDKEKATSYAVYGKLSDEELWVVKRYDLWDNLLQSGTFKDDQLSIAHGKFLFYMDVDLFNIRNQENFKFKDKVRFLSQQGTFVDGKEEGRWTLFFPDGNVFNTQDFVNGKQHGEFRTYDKYGNVTISGQYKNGEMDGEWFFNKDKRKDTYDNGILKSSVYIKKQKKVAGRVQ